MNAGGYSIEKNNSRPGESAGLAEVRITDQSLLVSITTVLSQFMTETDPYVLFNGLLDTLLEITGSEYGFIGEIFQSEDSKPYIKSYATTNIAWSDETKRLYEETKRRGMIFSRLDSLYGAVIRTGQLVISNHPMSDPRSCGVPKGHPSLDSFMGMPFYGGGELLGVAGIANRPGGYQQSLAESLRPFLTTCGTLILAYRHNLKSKENELELHRYREKFSPPEASISLGNGYAFNLAQHSLLLNGIPVLLTRKELNLLEFLVINRNKVVRAADIEIAVWPRNIVGESSLRSLMRRIRDKLPELAIRTISGVGYMLNTPD